MIIERDCAMNRQKRRSDIICRCNNISRETLEAAIRGGCHTMNDIFDETTAGVGPCGGSCRRKIVPMLQKYLETGTFPNSNDKNQSENNAKKTGSSTKQDFTTRPIKEQNKSRLIATLPHSGEKIPPEAHWLMGLDEITLMGDVDRYVDQLYEESLNKLSIPFVKTEWHRYAADLNRLDTDIDAEAVIGNSNPPGTFPRGFHWVYSTLGEKILTSPLTAEIHKALVQRVYTPFHDQVKTLAHSLLQAGSTLYHLDLHSMPSVGTAQHRDPGEKRKDIVISDSKGKSASPVFKDLVIQSFSDQGFSVAYNWPYFGGRLTEQYGHPDKNHHVIQIELNRSLYMNELTKKINPDVEPIKLKLFNALGSIKSEITSTSSRL